VAAFAKFSKNKTKTEGDYVPFGLGFSRVSIQKALI
jgi:hypothetical protein